MLVYFSVLIQAICKMADLQPGVRYFLNSPHTILPTETRLATRTLFPSRLSFRIAQARFGY